MNQAAPQNSTVVAKFGGTSVADFEAMNRSADVVLANPQVRRGVVRFGGRHQPVGRHGRGLRGRQAQLPA